MRIRRTRPTRMSFRLGNATINAEPRRARRVIPPDPPDPPDLSGSDRWPRDPPRVAFQASESDEQADGARHSTTDAERDDAEVPERPIVVPEREVEGVQAKEHPAIQPSSPSESVQNPARPGIDVEPRPVWIVEFDPQNGQRRVLTASIVIGVVLWQYLRLGDRHAR